MHIYIYAYIYMHIYIYTHTYIYIYTYIYIHIHILFHIYSCADMAMYLCMCLYIHTYIHICTCVCINVCIYTDSDVKKAVSNFSLFAYAAQSIWAAPTQGPKDLIITDSQLATTFPIFFESIPEYLITGHVYSQG